MIWYLSVLIITLTILLIVLLRVNDVIIPNDYKYLASAIGLSGFLIAIMGDGLFVKN